MATLTLQQALQLARQYESAGKSHDAETVYRQILAHAQQQPDALHGLGVLLYSAGDAPRAAELIGKAVAVKPGDAAFQSNYGTVLLTAGRTDDAITALRTATSLRPDWADAHYNLGNALKHAGQLPASITAYRRAIELDPKNFEAKANLGTALLELERFEEAVAAYREALALRPQLPDAHHNLGLALQRRGTADEAIEWFNRALSLHPDYPEAHHGLGIALQCKGALDQSISQFERALALRPNYPEALNGLGASLHKKNQFAAAIEVFHRALALRPDFPEVLCSLGAALRKINEPEQAIEVLRRAVALRADFPDAQVNLANSLYDIGEIDESIALLRAALTRKPDVADFHWCLGHALILKGEYSEGWAEHEWRRKDQPPAESEVGPRLLEWKGEPLDGRSILLRAEQGFGDAIQFARYAPLVANRGGRVVLAVRPPLKRMFNSLAGVEQIVTSAGEAPKLDFHCPLMSLPHVMQTTMETIPVSVPYLFAEPERIEKWRVRLADEKRLKIGLSWQGQPAHADDSNRSIALKRLAPLANVPSVRFFSLQKGFGSEQTKDPPAGMELTDWTDELPDFADTAALMANLDLIISVDTAVAHVAGAHGRPVWVLLPFAPDYRWMLYREDTPWYPTMRLFRQTRRADWQAPVQRLADELRGMRFEIEGAS